MFVFQHRFVGSNFTAVIVKRLHIVYCYHIYKLHVCKFTTCFSCMLTTFVVILRTNNGFYYSDSAVFF